MEEKLSTKERVLAAITKFRSCVSTPILQRVRVNAEELHRLTKELALEGKIKVWTDGRKTIFTLPEAPDPFQAGTEKKVASLNDATKASKPPRRVNRKAISPSIKSRAKKEQSVPAPRKPGGNGVYAAAIAELEALRTAALESIAKFDAALTALRALA